MDMDMDSDHSEDAESAGSACVVDTTPEAARKADSKAAQAYCPGKEKIPCLDNLHFDTTRCLILYHEYGYGCNTTMEDLVDRNGICTASDTLESLLLDANLTSTTTIADVCPATCCSSIQECTALGTIRLAGAPNERVPYAWEGRLEVWTTDFSTNYSGWSSVLTTRNWEYSSSLKACQLLGYDSMLSSDVRQVAKPASAQKAWPLHRAYWPAEPGKLNTRLAVGKCTGSETSFLQCPLEDFWGYDVPNHPIKSDIADKNSVSQVKGTQGGATWWEFFESGQSVVNLQCYNKSAEIPPIYEDLCSDGRCCSPRCLNKLNEVYEWDSTECTFPGFQCYERQACRDEGMCVSDHGVKGNQACNPECNSAACRMDDWDCCGAGEVYDLNSGHLDTCCTPTQFAPNSKFR
mmetsp:Transcript_12261/g.25748  ORF Transcript_12261/g.25748 Transcript_12261/m.25748 type:complete len:406 (-) Transcript_12261:2335-3552(-)